ncbi:pentapeptide repeat-containing protein [Amycolatopsis thermoflava]|uniref:pentapeptide repeat-containing protein n=1 Tax=Amycolatopsis thermoflava TaxID=84480 RepID=UPI00364DDAC1
MFGLVVLIAASVVALWWGATRGLEGKELVTARLDALKVGLSLGVGGGGLFALYLTWRRQRAVEATLAHQLQVAADTKAHQERVAADAREDATARRITELYTKAVEQLGSDKAPVRLGGVYALERLAQDNPSQRQTIVNVLCSYLGMPYQPPAVGPLTPEASMDEQLDQRERVQERRVRLTAQRVLTTHLARSADDRFWPGLDLDLTGAYLIDFALRNCEVGAVSFEQATFTGKTWFDDTTFTGGAAFGLASFHDDVSFRRATFNGSGIDARITFEGTVFNGATYFADATFTAKNDYILFMAANFNHFAEFTGATFDGTAVFSHATFTSGANFIEATFTELADFGHTRFSETVAFLDTTFQGLVNFPETPESTSSKFMLEGVRTSDSTARWPPGWTAVADEDEAGILRLVRSDMQETSTAATD